MTGNDVPALLYLWDRRTFYLGPLTEPLQLSQAAATLAVSLSGVLQFSYDGSCFSAQSVLLPAGINLRIETSGQTLAVCYLDPFGEDFEWLKTRFSDCRGELLLGMADEQSRIDELQDLQQREASPTEVAAYLERLIVPAEASLSPLTIDPRIVSTVALIKADVSSNLTAEYLAQQAGLSVPRLTQLFRETLGIPMRRYRQWHRLYVTTVRVANGMSLTNASLEAGFADSAHFCNTFRSIIGMKPSELLRHPDRVRLFAG